MKDNNLVSKQNDPSPFIETNNTFRGLSNDQQKDTSNLNQPMQLNSTLTGNHPNYSQTLFGPISNYHSLFAPNSTPSFGFFPKQNTTFNYVPCSSNKALFTSNNQHEHKVETIKEPKQNNQEQSNNCTSIGCEIYNNLQKRQNIPLPPFYNPFESKNNVAVPVTQSNQISMQNTPNPNSLFGTVAPKNEENMITLQNVSNNKGLSLEEIKANELFLRKNNNNERNNNILSNEIHFPKENSSNTSLFGRVKHEVLIIELNNSLRKFHNRDNQRRYSEDNNTIHTKYDNLVKITNNKVNSNEYISLEITIKEPSFVNVTIKINKEASFASFKQSLCEILRMKDNRYLNLTPNMFYLKKEFYIVKETSKLKQSSIKDKDSLTIIYKENAIIN